MSGSIYVWPSAGSFLANIADVPGCVARGATRDDAVANVRLAFRDYLELLRARGVSIEHWGGLDPDALTVKDPPDDNLVPEDREPLEEHEIRDFLHQMEGSRSALLALVRGLSADDLERKPTPETWSVRQALEHVMTSEAIFLSRLERWPDRDFAALQAVHRMAFQRFSILEPAESSGTHRILESGWSTRKVMRRILEHEYEHLQHVREILAALGGQRAPE